jgi:hypothetical protein
VPYVLRDRITGRGPGPCFQRERDARAAQADLEQLDMVSDWTTGKAVFPARQGLGRRGPITHLGWRERYAPELIAELVADFHAGRLPQ